VDDDDGNGSSDNNPETLAPPSFIWGCWVQQSLRPMWHRRRAVLGILGGDMLLAAVGMTVCADFGQQQTFGLVILAA
jgi:hypothetical protein